MPSSSTVASSPPVADAADDSPEARAYRRGFRDRGNKREDYAVDLLRQARDSLEDSARVDRILFELGRLYNPLIDGPIVDLATRRRVMELLGQARVDEASQILTERLGLYNPLLDGEDPRS
jgi:hypothetical protein